MCYYVERETLCTSLPKLLCADEFSTPLMRARVRLSKRKLVSAPAEEWIVSVNLWLLRSIKRCCTIILL